MSRRRHHKGRHRSGGSSSRHRRRPSSERVVTSSTSNTSEESTTASSSATSSSTISSSTSLSSSLSSIGGADDTDINYARPPPLLNDRHSSTNLRPFRVQLWILKSAVSGDAHAAASAALSAPHTSQQQQQSQQIPWYARSERVEFVQLPMYGGERLKAILDHMMVSDLHSTSTFVADISVLLLRYLNGVPADEQVYAITVSGLDTNKKKDENDSRRHSSGHHHKKPRKSKLEMRTSVTHIHLIRWLPNSAEWSPVLKWRGSVTVDNVAFDTKATTRRSLAQIQTVFDAWIGDDGVEDHAREAARSSHQAPTMVLHTIAFNTTDVIDVRTHPILFEYNDGAQMNAPPLLTSELPLHHDNRMMVFRYPSFNHMLDIADADMRHSRAIGKGGFGVIVTARWRGLGRVVIKYTNMKKRDHKGTHVTIPAIKRAKYAYAEAAYGCGFSHPNIAKYHGWFLHPHHNYSIGVVMERLDVTLSHALGSCVKPPNSTGSDDDDGSSGSEDGDDGRRRPSLTQHQVLGVLKGVNEALRHLHTRGFVHRDIKPANIMLDAEGVPKLIDLAFVIPIGSIARAAGSSRYQPEIMMASKKRGDSYDYLSPACDYYALAILILYRIHHGIPMPRAIVECAEYMYDLINQRQEADDNGPALPDLYALFDRALEKGMQSHHRRHSSSSAPPPRNADDRPATPTNMEQSPPQQQQQPQPRHRIHHHHNGNSGHYDHRGSSGSSKSNSSRNRHRHQRH